MNIELKPCPFCGKKPTALEVTFDEYGAKRLKIHCCMSFDIRADESIYTRREKGIIPVRDAVEKWNARVGEQDD